MLTGGLNRIFAVLVGALVATLSACVVPDVVTALVESGEGMHGFPTRVAETLKKKFPMKTRVFVNLNGGVARLAGRRICNNRIRYRNGMIGSLSEPASRRISRDAPEVKRLIALADKMRRDGIPFLFALAPDKMPLDNSLFPDGWTGEGPNGDARAVARLVAESGAEVLDLTSRFAATRADVEEHFFQTDHHWNVRTAFQATGLICDRLATLLNEPALRDNPRLSPDAWRWRVLKNGFVGAHGRRTGALFSGVEDFEYPLPRFATSQESFVPGTKDRRRGGFVPAEFVKRYLKPGQREWRWLAYGGPPRGLRVHRNATPVVKKRCLVVKDSFGRHVISFLSVLFREVVEVDPRLLADGETVEGITEGSHPDVMLLIVNPSSLLGARWWQRVGAAAKQESEARDEIAGGVM